MTTTVLDFTPNESVMSRSRSTSARGKEKVMSSREVSSPSLTIVIPALNEEDSIASTIHRCLATRQEIQDVGGVGQIEIIVVSDGSTDRTPTIAHEIASHETDVRVIVFETNRGYGSAIKKGFEQGIGEFVAFLDADGTCDPHYFGPMCRAMVDDQAAIVLGCRMGKESKMPAVRRLGNRVYAMLLGMLSGKAVEDTASGMRVIRRDALATLYPLPDGLNFTPAMSARALLNDLKIVEIPMAYAERVGRSKLSVLKDGVRFLGSIVDALLLFRPGRLFMMGATVCLIGALMWGLYPIEFYLRNGRLEEWMIYRVLFCAFSIICGCSLAVSGAFCDRVLELVYPASRQRRTFIAQVTEWLISPLRLLSSVGMLAVAALWLVGGGLWEYFATGHVTIHWSRVIAASMLLQLALLAVIGAVQYKMLALWRRELSQSDTKCR